MNDVELHIRMHLSWIHVSEDQYKKRRDVNYMMLMKELNKDMEIEWIIIKGIRMIMEIIMKMTKKMKLNSKVKLKN